MKKILVILLLLLCAAAPIEAKKHLQFMGLELCGTPEALKAKLLLQEGITFVRVDKEGN